MNYEKKIKVCWMSAGISSFMAGYLAGDVDEWIYIDVDDQEPDSLRFVKDCERVIGKEIKILKSKEYACVEDCVRAFRGFRNIRNGFSPCTNWLKKRVRKEWEYEHKDFEITYVWGLDFDERKRAENLADSMPEFNHQFPLIEKYLDKGAVHALFEEKFDIARPRMYELGYSNNNCVGCIKGGMGYWNRIRKDFPEVFRKRAELERAVGNTILKDGNTPIYLDELDPERGNFNSEIIPQCSIFCYTDL